MKDLHLLIRVYPEVSTAGTAWAREITSLLLTTQLTPHDHHWNKPSGPCCIFFRPQVSDCGLPVST
jgi:hypothetical protein